MAAVFVGVAIAKWRTARSPHAQGFIEVDQVGSTIHNLKTIYIYIKTSLTDRGSPSNTGGETCSEHASKWIRESNIQVFRSKRIN